MVLAQLDPTGDSSTAVAALTGIGIGLLLVAVGWLVIEVARRGASGRIPRNRLAGIRTRATLASDRAWAVGHQAGEADSITGGRVLQLTGLALVLVGLLAAVGAVPSTAAHLLIATGSLAGSAVMLFFVVRALRTANSAARAVGDEPE